MDAPDKQASNNNTVQAVENSLKIIESLKDLGGSGGVTEVAAKSQLSKGTTHKHLATLRQQDFVVKNEEGYRLGFRFLNIGSFIRNQVPEAAFIKQKVREIALETGEVGFFSIEECGRPIIIFREVGQEGVPTRSRVGMRLYLHQVAAGKAILSTFSIDEIERVVEQHGLPSATSETITDIDELIEDMERTRERGYALSNEEATEGLQAVGVPVSLSNNRAIGGCAVAGPVHRLEGKRSHEEIPKLLHSVANELELRIAHT